MSKLLPEQIEALRVLTGLWPGPRLGLIGATALQLQLSAFYRGTFDLDLSVTANVAELGEIMATLPGWHRDPRIEHRYKSPDGVNVDVIPAHATDLARGLLTWSDGREMTLLGMRHAFEDARPFPVAPDLAVRLATVPAIVLLKAVAYLDRPADRERDLGDIAFIFARYGDAEDERRFSTEVRESGLDFETSGCYLLGRDLGSIVDDREREAAEALIARLEGVEPGRRTRTVFKRLAPSTCEWVNEGRLDAALAAFRLGLGHPA